jgi:hypothetical protein
MGVPQWQPLLWALLLQTLLWALQGTTEEGTAVEPSVSAAEGLTDRPTQDNSPDAIAVVAVAVSSVISTRFNVNASVSIVCPECQCQCQCAAGAGNS